MADTASMRQLYQRLSAVGFTRPYLRKYVLPSTWKDEMASNAQSYDRLLQFLCRHLRIRLETLRTPTIPLDFERSRTRYFKRPDLERDIDAGLHVAEGVAAVAISGTSSSSTTIPSAASIRRDILSRNPWVSFQSLLSYCWGIGIPVLHVQNLPTGASKNRGIAVQINGRAAIVLCQRYKSPFRQLYPLAHEIGHIAADHLWYVDVMARASTEDELKFIDRTEGEAYRYTWELLTGNQTIPPDFGRYRSIAALVERMTERGQQMKIDPGYLIVHRATTTQDWREANAALDEIGGATNALQLINAEAVSHIDWQMVPSSSRSFFWRTTGAPLPQTALPAYRSSKTYVQPLSPPSPTVALFRQWAAKDVTDDPVILEQRQQDMDDLLNRLSRSRLNFEGRTDFSNLPNGGKDDEVAA